MNEPLLHGANGPLSTLHSNVEPSGSLPSNVNVGVESVVDAPGPPVIVVSNSSSAMCRSNTGGGISTGPPISVTYPGALATTRYYDNFSVSVPAAEPIVIHSGQSLEIRYDGQALREDSTGTYWGPTPSYRGSRFLVPCAGTEDRTTRIAVKARRNDIDTSADDQIADATAVAVAYTPRYLTP